MSYLVPRDLTIRPIAPLPLAQRTSVLFHHPKRFSREDLRDWTAALGSTEPLDDRHIAEEDYIRPLSNSRDRLQRITVPSIFSALLRFRQISPSHFQLEPFEDKFNFAEIEEVEHQYLDWCHPFSAQRDSNLPWLVAFEVERTRLTRACFLCITSDVVAAYRAYVYAVKGIIRKSNIPKAEVKEILLNRLDYPEFPTQFDQYTKRYLLQRYL